MSLRLLIVFAAICCPAATAPAQSTTFTYQGALTSAGQPASGPHDFRFKLFDSAVGGSQVGPTLCFDSVAVTSGQFSVRLDFGQQFVTTAQRHIEVLVRPEIGQPCTDDFAYVLLSPRQLISASPLATHAKSAFALAAADGSPASAVIVDNAGKVGIGTSTPTHNVHVAASGPTIALQDTNPASQQAGYVSYRDNANAERAWVGYGTPGSPQFSMVNDRPGGDLALHSGVDGHIRLATNVFALTVDPSGNVGIGTNVPSVKLDVLGDLHAFNAELLDLRAESISGGPSQFSGISGTFRPAVLVSDQTASNGIAIYGQGGLSSSNTSVIGVYGRSTGQDANSFGVFSAGRFASNGTKSFRIDHPDDPANQYLFHYCAESPEVINFYRGAVTLDGAGRAVVTLPSYFARINAAPTYQLTPVGAPMPMLHVAVRISDQALRTGAILEPGLAAPVCWFSIDGGVPGGEVSWRVEAVRNDEFVRRNGAPVEVQKPDHERGATEFTRTLGTP